MEINLLSNYIYLNTFSGQNVYIWMLQVYNLQYPLGDVAWTSLFKVRGNAQREDVELLAHVCFISGYVPGFIQDTFGVSWQAEERDHK